MCPRSGSVRGDNGVICFCRRARARITSIARSRSSYGSNLPLLDQLSVLRPQLWPRLRRSGDAGANDAEFGLSDPPRMGMTRKTGHLRMTLHFDGLVDDQEADVCLAGDGFAEIDGELAARRYDGLHMD